MTLIRLLALVSTSLAFTACGGSGDSATPASRNTTSNTTTVNYALTATRSYPADTATDGSTTLAQDTIVTIPAKLTITANATEAGRATLSFGGGVQCYYYFAGADSPVDYAFNSCTGGYTAGQQLSLSSASVLKLDVQDGYCTQTTTLQASVAGQY